MHLLTKCCHGLDAAGAFPNGHGKYPVPIIRDVNLKHIPKIPDNIRPVLVYAYWEGMPKDAILAIVRLWRLCPTAKVSIRIFA